ncbi:YitT family protein [Lacticaseibacillus parakribbianus]|uniref:YitT family protein n=1 Tax=Lacticaseibacillus parakribbianus TaxID=2970927 RepID=UPI0021CAED32|nr:YitT family protein [Lacticaseibacillus parakribbianus]
MKSQVSTREAAGDLLFVILGNGISAFAYSWVLVRLNIISGGVTATSMIAGRLTPLSVTFWTNAITLVCLGASLMFLGRRNFLNSIVSSLSYMGWFSLAQAVPVHLPLPVWVSLPLAGVCVGIGYFLCIAHHASTAGLDVFALVIHAKWDRFPVAASLRVINLLILSIGAWQFGLHSFLLGLVFIIIYTQTLSLLEKRFGVAL